MPAFNAISPEKLFRLIGTANCPTIVDVRPEAERLLPSARRLSAETVRQWAGSLPPGPVVVTCVHGEERSAGTAALLRHEGFDAEILEGGFAAWAELGLPVIAPSKLPPRDEEGRTRWVTRARPKVDRIACPWLIRRFVDPRALFLFVAPSVVAGVAERFDAAPFDVDGVFWSHRGAQCSFDTMIEELDLVGFDALTRLAPIVRGADTDHPELAPQASGLLAISLGLSRMHGNDLEQLEDGMVVYDALYRWCRDAIDETHNWQSHTPAKGRR